MTAYLACSLVLALASSTESGQAPDAAWALWSAQDESAPAPTTTLPPPPTTTTEPTPPPIPPQTTATALTTTTEPPPATTTTQAPRRTRLVILDLGANGVDASLVKTISNDVAVGLQRAQIVDNVTSAADLRAMLGLEADKQQSGADCDPKESCMAEIAQALGADVLVHGAVGRYGSLYTVTLSIYDARGSRAAARERAESDNLELLSRRIAFATERLALAYQGKSVDLAGAQPDDARPLAVLVPAGAVVAGVGVVGAITFGVWTASSSSTLLDPNSKGLDKTAARDSYGLTSGLAFAAAAVAVVGVGVAGAGVLLE